MMLRFITEGLYFFVESECQKHKSLKLYVFWYEAVLKESMNYFESLFLYLYSQVFENLSHNPSSSECISEMINCSPWKKPTYPSDRQFSFHYFYCLTQNVLHQSYKSSLSGFKKSLIEKSSYKMDKVDKIHTYIIKNSQIRTIKHIQHRKMQENKRAKQLPYGHEQNQLV